MRVLIIQEKIIVYQMDGIYISEKMDALLEKDFDTLVSVTLVNQYYLIEKFFDKYKYDNKRIIVIGSRSSEWAGIPLPQHGMKYAIEKKAAFDAVRFIQNDKEKNCTAQIINLGKELNIKDSLEKHFRYLIDNPEIQEISYWGVK